MARRRTDLRGTVVAITGASSGIGRACALAFADAGGRLVLAARREDALDETATQCCQRGGEAHVVKTGVTVEADLERLRNEAHR